MWLYQPLCTLVDSSVVAGILRRLHEVAEDRSPPAPAIVRDNVGWIGNEWSVVCVELTRLVRRPSPLPAWTHESRACWVSCVCWAGMSCQKDGSWMSHRSETPCSCSCRAHGDQLGTCSPLCWSFSVLRVSSIPNLGEHNATPTYVS